MSRKKTKPSNYAFIDNENVNMSIQKQWWKMDRGKLRRWLSRHHHVTKAYMFMGYTPEHQEMYTYFQHLGYVLVFKPMLNLGSGVKKWNVDAELVLQAMIDVNEYDQAVIVSGDGDFACLVRYLYAQQKLDTLIVPNIQRYSDLLNHAAKEKLISFTNLKRSLAYRSHSKTKPSTQSKQSTQTKQTKQRKATT